jgi:hypothetical protein
MPGNHAVKFLCWLLAVPLVGCVGEQLAAVPAPGTAIIGAWKLNPATSDDPEKVIEKMRVEAQQRINRHSTTQQLPMQRPGTRGRGMGGTSQGDTQDSTQQDSPAPGHPLDPLRNSQMMKVLAAALARGDFLSVRNKAGEVVFDYGTSERSFTPGQHSVVSAEGGVGDQTSGWKGRDYVINIRAQMGPDVEEHYAVSADGKHLIEKLRIGPAELPAVDLTRVYDQTNQTAPRQLPTGD